MIELFKHNQEAYESAVAMLDAVGKACIIHPTGTGKSFIGFKLCEDNPDKTVLWLSPSEYIFKTQLENLAKVSDDFVPENILFMTYAKLSMMSEEDIAGLSFDYLILDEFHRGGSEIWGSHLKMLLDAFPNVPVLGLSATAIRYLDNQRNMADELFSGNIASELTLGDAIVRGILNPPKYILSIYSYQKDLEKYEDRVRRAKSKAVRDKADEYLEQLRRSLENADGLDKIFEKHMTDKHGKYIVFTPNYDTMQEYISQCANWFWRVDRDPQIYSVYSDDSAADEEFQRFKNDNSDHLRLLFCIDALNEGVHVEDVSGVILMRPTVSPIIYKQQIGRALSASKSKEPVIFDIVNNIENLYSIDSIKEEMQVAISYYRSFGNGDMIKNVGFELLDKVEDCRALFDELEDTLTASWELMYEKCVEYYKEHNNLDVPVKYVTSDGHALGPWLQTQRRVYKGAVNGILTSERIEKLNKLGMRWDSAADVSWERYYNACVAYKEKYGDLCPIVSYVNDDGVALGRWIAQIRTNRSSGIKTSYLTEEHISALDELGMVWEVHDFMFEKFYYAAVKYYEKFGNLDVPVGYINDEGLRLGSWIDRLRLYYKTKNPHLTDEEINRLNSIGMQWEKRFERRWNTAYVELKLYKEKYRNLNVPLSYVTESGFKLGQWYNDQLYAYGRNLSKKREALLRELGVQFDREDPWDAKYALAKEYYDLHGNLSIPANYVAKGVWLHKWLSEQRLIGEGKRKKKLTYEQREKLEAIGVTFGKLAKDNAWDRQFEKAKSYIDKHGSLAPTGDPDKEDKKVNCWIINQRKLYKEGKLSDEKIKKLESIGMVWNLEDPFEIGFEHAKEYYKKHGGLIVQIGYVCDDGYPLSNWIANIRNRRDKRLTKEQIVRLDSIGMIWNMNDYRWEQGFLEAERYYSENHSLDIDAKYRTGRSPEVFYWVVAQREAYRDGKLSDEQIKRLENIGMDWLSPVERAWENGFQNVESYVRKNNTTRIPATYRNDKGEYVGMWLRRQVEKKEKLSDIQIQRLQRLGIAI